MLNISNHYSTWRIKTQLRQATFTWGRDEGVRAELDFCLNSKTIFIHNESSPQGGSQPNGRLGWNIHFIQMWRIKRWGYGEMMHKHRAAKGFFNTVRVSQSLQTLANGRSRESFCRLVCEGNAHHIVVKRRAKTCALNGIQQNWSGLVMTWAHGDNTAKNSQYFCLVLKYKYLNILKSLGYIYFRSKMTCFSIKMITFKWVYALTNICQWDKLKQYMNK